MSKLKREDLIQLKKNAKLEEALYIRAILDDLIQTIQNEYEKTTTDHRYLQGGLHTLRRFRGLITKE